MEIAARRSADFDAALLSCREALLRRAFRLEATRDAACDLVQETMERALRHAIGFEPGTNVRAWLFKIMFNLFVDRCRQRCSEVAFVDLDDRPLPAGESELESGPDWRDLDMPAAEALLSQLPGRLRDPLELRVHFGLSYQEIGRRLKVSPRTIGTRLHRARRRLRALLGREPFREGARLDVFDHRAVANVPRLEAITPLPRPPRRRRPLAILDVAQAGDLVGRPPIHGSASG